RMAQPLLLRPPWPECAWAGFACHDRIDGDRMNERSRPNAHPNLALAGAAGAHGRAARAARVLARAGMALALGGLLFSSASAGVWTQIGVANPQLTALASSDTSVFFATLSPTGTPNGADV